MDKAIVVVNAKIKLEGKLITSPVTDKMLQAQIAAIKQGNPSLAVEIVTPATLRQLSDSPSSRQGRSLFCPLTLQIPSPIAFSSRDIFQTCQDIKGLRNWVGQTLEFPTLGYDDGFGDRWLPAMVAPNSIRFGSLIEEGIVPNAYQISTEIDEKKKKSLYVFGKKLLNGLNAPPAVYLLQLRFTKTRIFFDRLWPFPAAPAIASLGLNEPNLYALHWQCLQQTTVDGLLKGSLGNKRP